MKRPRVDIGETTQEINIELVEPEIGDVVLVHAGVAIAVLGRVEYRDSSRAPARKNLAREAYDSGATAKKEN